MRSCLTHQAATNMRCPNCAEDGEVREPIAAAASAAGMTDSQTSPQRKRIPGYREATKTVRAQRTHDSDRSTHLQRECTHTDHSIISNF